MINDKMIEEVEKLFDQWKDGINKINSEDGNEIFMIINLCIINMASCHINTAISAIKNPSLEKKLKALDGLFFDIYEESKDQLKQLSAH